MAVASERARRGKFGEVAITCKNGAAVFVACRRCSRGVDPGAALGDFCGDFCRVFYVCDSASKIGAAMKKKF